MPKFIVLHTPDGDVICANVESIVAYGIVQGQHLMCLSAGEPFFTVESPTQIRQMILAMY